MPENVTTPPRERRFGTRGLLVVNGLLLVLLGAVAFGARAEAQVRARGTYAVVAGGVKGANASAVYVVDTTNQELIAIRWEPSQKVVKGIGYRNLAVDMQAAAGGSR